MIVSINCPVSNNIFAQPVSFLLFFSFPQIYSIMRKYLVVAYLDTRYNYDENFVIFYD